MSDNFSVSPEGNLMMPLIGTIRAAGMSVAELAGDISKRLQNHARLGDAPYTSVEIVQFRPFYVTGDVQRPGEYPYRPGMTVLMALSLSGGLYRGPPSSMIRPTREVIAGEGALTAALAKQSELLIKQALLKTELAGDELQEKGVKALQERFQNSEAFKNQLFIFRERRQVFLDQVNAFRGRIAIYQNQIKYLRLQIDSTIKQRQSVERELATQQGLIEKGLALAPRIATLERLASQIEGDQRGLETSVTRAQDSIAAFEAEIRKLTNERERDSRIELAKTSRELEDVVSKIETERKLIAEAESVTAILKEKSSRRLEIRMSVSRDEDGQIRTFGVDNDSRLDPGDVLVIEERPASLGEASIVSPNSD